MDIQTKPSRATNEIATSDGSGFSVNRRSGTENSGFEYEKYALLWVLLGLLEDSNIQEFYLAGNVEGVGAFDDIIIRVKRKLPEENRIARDLICVQLKHKENIDKKITWQEVTGHRRNPYQLQRYYEEYKNKMLASIGKFGDPVLDECREEEITLVLYTNASFEFEENSYDMSSFYRKLLESQQPSMVLDFKEENMDLWTKLETYNSNLCTEKKEVQKFLNKFVIFSKQCNVTMFKEKLINKLSHYFPRENMSLDHALQRAIEFIVQNNSMWLSRNSGALFDVIFKYQGVPVKLNEIVRLWDSDCSKESESTRNEKLCFMNKIIVQHMCLSNAEESLCIGKPLKRSEPYYIKRRPVIKYERSAVYELYYSHAWKHLRVAKIHDQKEFNDFPEYDGPFVLYESFILLCGGPGMGKSSFFTHMAKLLKDSIPHNFVIRENLIDFSKYLRDVDINSDNRIVAKKFLLNVCGVTPGTAEHDLFELSLHNSKMMTIFLDGVDEITPHYYEKLLSIIMAIRKEFDVQLWVSTRPVVRERMEEDLLVNSWMLRKFTKEEVIECMQKYCGNNHEISIPQTGLEDIPIFCRMLGDIIKSGNMADLRHIKNEAELYDNFVDIMYEVYHLDKKKSDDSIPATKRDMEKLKKIAMEDHEMAALLEIFDEKQLLELNWDIKYQCENFLNDISEGQEKAGLIIDIVNGRPRFIHRTIAEYFSGRWFSKNRDKYIEFTAKYEMPRVIEFHMTHKLCDSDLFLKLILLQEKEEINKYIQNYVGKLSVVDHFGRDVLYYVDRFLHNVDDNCWYNIASKVKITEDIFKNMKSYNEKTEYFLNLQLLYFFLDSLDVKNNPQYEEVVSLILTWLLVGTSFSYHSLSISKRNLLLNYCTNVPLHVSIIEKTYNDENLEYVSDQDINSKNDLGLTPLHIAAVMDNNVIVEALHKLGAEYSRENVLGVYPHQLCRSRNENFFRKHYSRLETEDNIRVNVMAADYMSQNLPLHDAVRRNDLERVQMESAAINSVDFRGRTALHVVAAATSYLDSKIMQHLFNENIAYVRDKDGFYAHDYGMFEKLFGYGIRSYLTTFPENKQNIFGKHISDIIKDLTVTDPFKRGVEGRT